MFDLLLLAAAGTMTPPVNLVLEGTGEQARLMVIGESPVPLTARYELEASSSDGNQSVQTGTVRLLPGQRVVLVSLSMGGATQGWSATLRVNHDGGSYEQVKKAR
ncbi:curli-like amyloid fiber formation chaperone CsgH [Sphingomonas sp. LHG3443-2]|uniref:curli-like amyloid fiber formation chaperone CsgH n=1 Tax=Sphingomonas sp. LHG3443-2 TaxID=2804639 RepID=UPI003CF53E16